MIKVNGKLLSGAFLPLLLFGTARLGAASVPRDSAQTGSAPQISTLAQKVRHELVMLPYFSVFDDLAFSIEGTDTVVLTGQVTRPILKSDAEGVTRRVAGVGKVVNNIEVLPLSPFDNSIRLAAYRAIFSRPGFAKYAVQAVSPIRIIVKNGNITLNGFVGNQMDKTLADMAARSVPGAFSVTDNLKIG
jgi:hyperosmotically inducible protein